MEADRAVASARELDMLLTLPIREILPATPRAQIVRLDLGGRPFPYRAGQAVFVGTHGDPRREPYSLTGAPEESRSDDCLELLVRTDRAGARGPSLAPGECLDVEGPVGQFTFPVEPAERRFIFIAGGTGIAPLRAMVRHALRTPHREIHVLYSARTGNEFAYENELRALARDGRLRLHQTITRCDVDDSWTGNRGRIGRRELQALVDDPATLCFICGPLAFVADTRGVLEELGLPRERIKIEEW